MASDRPTNGRVELEGKAFLDGRSKAWPARLIVPDSARPFCQLEIEGADGDGKRPRLVVTSIATITDRLGRMDRTVELEAEGAVFSCPDHPDLDRLTPLQRGRFTNVAGLEQGYGQLAAFTACVAGLLVAMWVWGVPLAARAAAWATPPAVTRTMEKSTFAAMERFALQPTKLPQERRDALRTRFDRLVAASPDAAGHTLNLNFRASAQIGANAFALPGGTIVVTDGLAKLLTDDEVVAVLGHEIVHVTHRHSLRQIYRGLGVAALASVVLGDVGGLMEEVVGGGGVLSAMAASREMELEADDEGITLLRAAGEDPKALATALQKLTRAACPKDYDCESTGWLSSHPGSAERNAALEEALGVPIAD